MDSNALTIPGAEGLAPSAHPWRRYFARTTDLALYGVLWAAIQYLLLRWWPPQNLLISVLEQYIVLALMFAVEPALLCSWGTTPGKWIMGLRLRSENGGKLTYKQALRRTGLLFAKGLGYGIPIYNLVRMAKSRRESLDYGALDWEEGTSYVLLDEKQLRGWGIGLAHAACIALAIPIMLAGILPLHRGDLTPAQYAENCNEQFRRGSAQNRFVMDGEGRISQTAEPNIYAIQAFAGEPPRHELRVENGLVKGVRLEVRGDWINAWVLREQVAVACMAFVGAQKRADGLSVSNLANAFTNMLMGPFDMEVYGVRIHNEFTQLSDSEIHIVFTMQKE